MRRLIPFICLSALICSCADQGEPDPQCPEQKECEQCDKTECPAQTECPTLECDGNKCPTCPTCDPKECPPAQCDGKECPVCDTCETCETCETCDKSALESENTKLKGDLQAQVEATEACTGDLDTCNNNLNKAQLRNLKSGSRLKVYNYVGEDGSQWPSPYIFDSKKNVNCGVQDFSDWVKYGCVTQLYCVTTNKYSTDMSYSAPYLPDSNNYTSNPTYYCNSTYDSTNFTHLFKTSLQNATQERSIQHYENKYYTDSSCTIPLVDPFIDDTTCKYDSNSQFYEESYKTKTEYQRACMDGSGYTYSESKDLVYDIYQAKTSSYTKLYEKNSSGKCNEYTYYKHVILLKLVQELTAQEVKDMAKTNRDNFCKQVCTAINKEAVEEDWAKIQKVVAE